MAEQEQKGIDTYGRYLSDFGRISSEMAAELFGAGLVSDVSIAGYDRGWVLLLTFGSRTRLVQLPSGRQYQELGVTRLNPILQAINPIPTWHSVDLILDWLSQFGADVPQIIELATDYQMRRE